MFWENTAQFLGPDSGPERLFTGLPTDLDPDSQRQVQAIRLASAGISPTTNIRWLRLLQTARDVAEHHP